MERKWLSVRFGIGLVYYMDGVQIPEPTELSLSAQEEEDGISPEEWARRLVAFAEAEGVTHIWDDNVAEDAETVLGSGEELTLPDFKDLVRELYGV